MNNKMIFYIVLLTCSPLAASEKDDGNDISQTIKVQVCLDGVLEGYRIIGAQGPTLWDYSYRSYETQVTNKKVLIVDKIFDIGGTANVVAMGGCESLPVETARIIFYDRLTFKSRIERFLSVYNMCAEANSEKEPFYIHLVEDKKDTECTKAISLQFTKKQVEDLLYNKSFYMSILSAGAGIVVLALLIYYFNLC